MSNERQVNMSDSSKAASVDRQAETREQLEYGYSQYLFEAQAAGVTRPITWQQYLKNRQGIQQRQAQQGYIGEPISPDDFAMSLSYEEAKAIEAAAQTPAAVDYTTSTGAKWGELSSDDQWYEYRTVRAELQVAREANAALWKFYDFMFGVDATGDVMDALKSDMYAGAQHELLTGDSQMNRDTTQVWADYDALLTELKALKASGK